MSNFKEQIPGGLAAGKKPSDFNAKQLRIGTKVELEHVVSKGRRPTKAERDLAQEIAMDHLMESPHYYEMLKNVEEAMEGNYFTGFVTNGKPSPKSRGKVRTGVSKRKPSARKATRNSKKGDKLREQDKPEVLGYELRRSSLTPVREKIDTSAPGDYGSDPIGEVDGVFMFKMVPSGDIVDHDEMRRRLDTKATRNSGGNKRTSKQKCLTKKQIAQLKEWAATNASHGLDQKDILSYSENVYDTIAEEMGLKWLQNNYDAVVRVVEKEFKEALAREGYTRDWFRDGEGWDTERNPRKKTKIPTPHKGSLGGPGYTDKLMSVRHRLLKKHIKDFGVASTVSALQSRINLGKNTMGAKALRVFESDKTWVQKQEKSSKMAKRNPRAKKSSKMTKRKTTKKTRNAVVDTSDGFSGESSDRKFTLEFRNIGDSFVAHHEGVEYRITGKHFGEYRVLRDGKDWMDRPYNGLLTAASIAADIAQATGARQWPKDWETEPKTRNAGVANPKASRNPRKKMTTRKTTKRKTTKRKTTKRKTTKRKVSKRKVSKRRNPERGDKDYHKRNIILGEEVLDVLPSWTGSQSSMTYSLSSTGASGLVSASMIDAAIEELESMNMKNMDAADKEELDELIGNLDMNSRDPSTAEESGAWDDDHVYEYATWLMDDDDVERNPRRTRRKKMTKRKTTKRKTTKRKTTKRKTTKRKVSKRRNAGVASTRRLEMNPSPKHKKFFGIIGDSNPIEHWGGTVIDQGQGPILTYFQLGGDDDLVSVYWMSIEDDVTGYHDWVDWVKVAEYVGQDVADLKKYGKDKNPLARASVIEAAASYYGWDNFDSEPQVMTVEQAEAKYGREVDAAHKAGNKPSRNAGVASTRTRNWPKAAGADAQAADELYLYMTNTGEIFSYHKPYGALGRQLKSIIENLVKRKKKGTYDKSKAPKLFKYWVDGGAKEYGREFGDRNWATTFSVATRMVVAKEFTNWFDEAYAQGEFDDLTRNPGRKKATKRAPKRKTAKKKVARRRNPKAEWPPKSELARLFKALQPDIDDDMVEEEGDEPSMTVTIGSNGRGGWNYQTGDNSFTGGAYGYPYWAVMYLTRDSDVNELAEETIQELDNSGWEAGWDDDEPARNPGRKKTTKRAPKRKTAKKKTTKRKVTKKKATKKKATKRKATKKPTTASRKKAAKKGAKTRAKVKKAAKQLGKASQGKSYADRTKKKAARVLAKRMHRSEGHKVRNWNNLNVDLG